MPRVLVTGGAGFIGSHLTDLLLGQGAEVTVIDDLSTGRRGNLASDHPRLRLIESDLTAALEDWDAEDRFDAIYHLAATVGVGLVMDDPIASIENNVGGTAALLAFAARNGADGSGCPTLIASSSEVYGKPDTDLFSEDDDSVYGSTQITRWAYAQTKALDEHLALAHHRRGSVPCVVARLFNTVGPRQVGSYGMVLPRFVGAALRDDDLEVHGDGSQTRCFCDVRDVAGVLPRLLQEPACRGRVFNVGSDAPISIGDLASRVIELTGSSSGIRFVPYSAAYPAGFEDLKQRRPDLRRIRETIGFAPEHDLRRTILDTASFLREHAP